MKWPSQSGRGTRVQMQVSSSLPSAVPMSHGTPGRQWGWGDEKWKHDPCSLELVTHCLRRLYLPPLSCQSWETFRPTWAGFHPALWVLPFFQMQSVSCLVVYDSLQPHRLQPTSLLCPRNSPGKNTGEGFPSPSPGSGAKPLPNKEVQKSEFTLCVYPGVSC